MMLVGKVDNRGGGGGCVIGAVGRGGDGGRSGNGSGVRFGARANVAC